MNRRSSFMLMLLPIGPLCVGFLRLLLPYYGTSDNVAAARAVVAQPGRESAVLWLGLAAVLTLVPGVYAARGFLPATRLRSWAIGLVVAGYLCLPALLAGDLILWVGADQELDPAVTGRLLDSLHPSFSVALGVFIVGHVLGTVALGIACLRSEKLPPVICWALIVSQPLHFVTTVFLGLPWLDLVAWTLTAGAMGAIALANAQEREPITVKALTRAG